jgi:hypothetical protein
VNEANPDTQNLNKIDKIQLNLFDLLCETIQNIDLLYFGSVYRTINQLITGNLYRWWPVSVIKFPKADEQLSDF